MVRFGILIMGIVACGCSTAERTPTLLDAMVVPESGQLAVSPDSMAPSESRRPSICDGSTELRLRVFIEPQNDRELRGSIVRVENGYPSFALDGTCTYWMGSWSPDDPMARDRGWRVGRVTPAFQEVLDRTFVLTELSELGDCHQMSGSFDYAIRTIRSANFTVRCRGNGALFDKAWDTIEGQAAELWAAAVPVSQTGVRISAIEAPSEAPGLKEPYEWPMIGASLSSFLVSDGGNPRPQSGISKLVSLPGADTIRSLREQYLTDRLAAPALFGDGLEVSDGTLRAIIYLRDALPYDDEHGLLPFSDEP